MSEPPVELNPGEKVLREIAGDTRIYWRDTAAIGAIALVLTGAILWIMGNQFLLIGLVGVVLAIGLRGLYLRSEQMSLRWWLTNQRVVLASGGSVMLLEIETVRRLFNDVQLVTRAGDKHLLKHIADAEKLATEIGAARERRRRTVR